MEGKVRVEVNSHNQYVIGGREYARVTSISHSAESKKQVDEWRKRVGEAEADRISRETAEWGERVHEITAWNDRGKQREVDKMLLADESLLPSLLAWREWVGVTIRKWVLIEEVLYSCKLRIAGRVDRVGYIVGDKNPSIADIKTGALWDDTGVQIWGAYRELYNDNPSNRKGGKKPVGRGLAVQISRKEPGVLRVKDYTKDKYIADWEQAKRDYWNATGR